MAKQKDQLNYIPLDKLDPSPLNSNEMSEAVYEKVKENIRRSGRYPAGIVRPKTGTDRYEILDGWHRSRIVAELGHTEFKCEVWDIDDKQATLLLATLNRLKGTDDTKKRARLLAELYEEFDQDAVIMSLLPESQRAFDSLLSTLEEDTAKFDTETERGLVEEKLLQAGVDDATAQQMANTYQPPSSSNVWVLKFVFKDITQYNKAAEYFGKNGNPDDLIALVEHNETTNKKGQAQK